MRWCVRVVWGLAVCAVCLPDAAGHEPPVKSKAKVEFRWLEVRSVRGLTDDMGIQTTCRPELMYPHVKPVLTNPDVAGTTMTEHDFSTSGLGVLYIVELRLTDKAREKLVKEAGDRPSVELAVFVEGSYSGAWYFRKAEAAEFTPSAGFIPKAEAERIVEACK